MTNLIVLGGKEFKSKKDLSAWCKRLLSCLEPGEYIKSNLTLVMIDLLSRHYKAHEILPRDVKGFMVARDRFGGKAFHVIGTDDTRTIFSYAKCVSGKTPTTNQGVSQAARHLVSSQMFAAKDGFIVGDSTCAITGEKLNADFELDHYPVSFKQILAAWLESEKLRPREIEIKVDKDFRTFLDSGLGKSWQDFHFKHAQYRPLLKEVHKEVTRQQNKEYLYG